MRRIAIASFSLSLIIAFSSCSDKITAPKYTYGAYPLSGSFNWSETGVIWENNPNKKSLSLMIVGASWCGHTRKLLSQTLKDSTVMGLIHTYFNACIIDGDTDSLVAYQDTLLPCKTVRDRLGVRGYPTTVFFDQSGNKIFMAPGFYDAREYADGLWRIVEGQSQD